MVQFYGLYAKKIQKPHSFRKSNKYFGKNLVKLDYQSPLKELRKTRTLGWDIIDTLQKPNRVKLCHNYLELPLFRSYL